MKANEKEMLNAPLVRPRYFRLSASMVLRPLVLTPSFSMLLNTLLILFTVVYAQTNLVSIIIYLKLLCINCSVL
uniref:Uncharacterized protein n=1 Tax=Heterorhabditis bacteriophora TaxID=37862 RepID=A0A1I7WUE0_HETBA